MVLFGLGKQQNIIHSAIYCHSIHKIISMAFTDIIINFLFILLFFKDDTLLCSSFLSSKGLRLDTNSSKIVEFGLANVLKQLETSIISVLKLAQSHGQVYIITNAETGWIQLSAQKFIPGVLPIISTIPLISARSTYESQHPDSPLKWKFYAFQDTLAPHLSKKGKWKNIMSFGDSHVEREAVRAVTRGQKETRCKSVKFAERPSLEQLKRQQELVANCFTYIFSHDGDLDLQLTVTVNATNNINSQQQQQLNQNKTKSHFSTPSKIKESNEKLLKERADEESVSV